MEKKIYITNTGTVIYPYKKGQSKALERMTTMKDQGCKFKRIEVNGFRVDELFLTYHLQPFFIKNEFPDYEIEYIEPHKYDAIPEDIPFEMNEEFVLDGNQIKVADVVVKDFRGGRWFINCPQGFGKTILSIYIMTRFRCNTLIMCYSTSILKQWKERILEQTTIPGTSILYIDSSSLISSILNDTYDKLPNYNVFIATPKIIWGYAKNHGYDLIDKFFKKLNLGLKVYDEAHRDLGNIVRIDALSSVRKTLYLSGDFAQASAWKTRLFLDIFRNVKVVKPIVEDEIDLRYTKAVVVEYNSNPTPIDIMNVMSKRGTDVWKYMKYQINKGVLMRVVYWILDNILSLKEKNRRILILTSMIEHCDYIYDEIKSRYDQCLVGKIHGENNPEDNQFSKDNAQIIIATYSSFGTGMDTKYIKYVISTSASNRVEDSQTSGRARPLSDGEDCLYWMCIDTGFERQVEKEKERIDYLKAIKVKEVIKLKYEE